MYGVGIIVFPLCCSLMTKTPFINQCYKVLPERINRPARWIRIIGLWNAELSPFLRNIVENVEESLKGEISEILHVDEVSPIAANRPLKPSDIRINNFISDPPH